MSTAINASTWATIDAIPLDFESREEYLMPRPIQSSNVKATHLLSFLTEPPSDTDPGGGTMIEGPTIPIEDYQCFRQGFTEPVTFTMYPETFRDTVFNSKKVINSVLRVSNFFCHHQSRTDPAPFYYSFDNLELGDKERSYEKVDSEVSRNYNFTLSYLPDDIKSEFIQDDILKPFRSVEFTIDLSNNTEDHLLESFKQDHPENVDVTGKLVSLPVNELVAGVDGISQQSFAYEGSWISTGLNLSLNVDSPNTRTTLEGDEDAVKDKLRSLLQDRRFTIPAVSSLIVEGDDMSDALRRRIRQEHVDQAAGQNRGTANELDRRRFMLAEYQEALSEQLHGPL
ncbi:uncharacterized protein IL334_006743 [Kwoniella shivajii]|uniref:Uncharacterized protein n=1 Tax=Kwoniella shivajii TaxID=564305 RepID=A0ABZ1D818_9TREE|nr:hypothetical protein IL334_006743 [Kwoniella shivajii]